ncbi:uncharacterized protein EI90DRAFT_1471344 [Cantharellus anzutake]|uniref:uncharacterized protein n=1 Tax=Cantharellus anzutake TaxID=1750568 RepID=UPI0019072EE1|nr:uncharacterized protein EI90DRAFT_1471344 [Cantharellus anzutake]KAF8309533.1 hypothetical protein EI90DRAFT_1471344 [Cantharellus anzutake]
MSSLPDNTELRQRLASLYLGDANIASKAVWVYAKARRCHVLCLHGINKTTLNPTPVVLHGIFTLARHPFKLVPDGGFLESTAELYFGHTPLHEAMARTNAWARLEKVHDKDLLGYNDFSQYIKNLKGFESLMHAGDSLQHSLVNDEGATGPQVKVIHRMFESCWDTIRVTTTPQQDIEAKLKMRYKLTPGDHPVAVRLANSKQKALPAAEQ